MRAEEPLVLSESLPLPVLREPTVPETDDLVTAVTDLTLEPLEAVSLALLLVSLAVVTDGHLNVAVKRLGEGKRGKRAGDAQVGLAAQRDPAGLSGRVGEADEQVALARGEGHRPVLGEIGPGEASSPVKLDILILDLKAVV